MTLAVAIVEAFGVLGGLGVSLRMASHFGASSRRNGISSRARRNASS